MSNLAIVTQGLAPGMWAVVSKVISWEWLEGTGRVRWQVETILPPHVVRSAVPTIVSIESARSGDPKTSTPKPAARRKSAKKRIPSVADDAAA